MKNSEKAVATMTIHGLPKMTKIEKRRVLAWLKSTAHIIEKEECAGRFTARLFPLKKV